LDDVFVAIDHREAGSSCRFELFASRRSWLGPFWTMDGQIVATSTPRPRSWMCDSSGNLAEWSYRAGEARICHSVLVLRERSLALLSVLIEKRPAVGSSHGLRISLPPTITAEAVMNSRAFLLTTPKKPGSAQVLPIGLPSLAYPSDRGSFEAQDHALVLSQASGGRRSWLALLVSWDSKRHRRNVNWRPLTVSEKSRKVAADRAFAVRVRWGRDETYVVYRSLGPPAPRAFLGHQTTARYLVGRFQPDGTVEPIIKVE